jgi:hypothetical protein
VAFRPAARRVDRACRGRDRRRLDCRAVTTREAVRLDSTTVPHQATVSRIEAHPVRVRGGAAQQLVLLLEEPDPAIRFAQLCRLRPARTATVTVVDRGLAHPLRQR